MHARHRALVILIIILSDVEHDPEFDWEDMDDEVDEEEPQGEEIEYDEDEDAANGSMEVAEPASAGAHDAPVQVYLPGDHIDSDDELVCDASAYVTLQEFSLDWPCLSFDVLRDGLGDQRQSV